MAIQFLQTDIPLASHRHDSRRIVSALGYMVLVLSNVPCHADRIPLSQESLLTKFLSQTTPSLPYNTATLSFSTEGVTSPVDTEYWCAGFKQASIVQEHTELTTGFLAIKVSQYTSINRKTHSRLATFSSSLPGGIPALQQAVNTTTSLDTATVEARIKSTRQLFLPFIRLDSPLPLLIGLSGIVIILWWGLHNRRPQQTTVHSQ